MLNVTFYSKGKKTFGRKTTCQWAMIFCTEDDYENEDATNEILENSFDEGGGIYFEEVPVFESETLNLTNMSDVIFETIKNIVKVNNPEVVLISTMDFFKRAVHFSKKDEMDPQMVVTENRDMLYYSMIGEDKCALLVAWDSYEDYEKEAEN